MNFLIIICFGTSFAHSFYKIYDNPKYDSFRGITFNDSILAIATNDSVIFGKIDDNFIFEEIGSKQLTTFLMGYRELKIFKFLQKDTVFLCDNHDCCYCKMYGVKNDDKCMMIGVRETFFDFDSIDAQQYNILQNDGKFVPKFDAILFIRYITLKRQAYLATFLHSNNKYYFINTTADRLSLQVYFSSIYSFALDDYFYFISEFEKTGVSGKCPFPEKFETQTNEIYFILTQFCQIDLKMKSRIDLLLSCKSSNSHAEKLYVRGVAYSKVEDLLRFTIEDTKNSSFFCEFKMDTIVKSFCDTFNYCLNCDGSNNCLEYPFKISNRFPKDCQKEEASYGPRCYKERTSADYCYSPKPYYSYIVNSCQIKKWWNNSYLSMENHKIIYGSNNDNMWNGEIYGMLTCEHHTIVFRKRQKSIFSNNDDFVMMYQSMGNIIFFDIDNDKFLVSWDNRKGVLYIDPRIKNSIYFKTTFCPKENCTEYLFHSPITCKHLLCNELAECSKSQHTLCGPLWFNRETYEIGRKLEAENGTEELVCSTALANNNCSYDFQVQYKTFLTAPFAYSPPTLITPKTISETPQSLKWIIVVFGVSLLFILFGTLAIKNSFKKSIDHIDSSVIQMNDLNHTPATSHSNVTEVFPGVGYDCIDQYGNVNKEKLKKDRIISNGISGFVQQEFLITHKKIKKVAVKYRYKSYDESDLQNEINTIKSCKHGNIIRFIGKVQNDDGVGIVMEFMEGGNLYGHLINPEKTLIISQLFNFISQIVDALVYLSHLHILHRDIASRNCLLNATHAVIKISGFGLACKMNPVYQCYAKTEEKFSLSMRWYPLEIMDTETCNTFTSKVDIWSFGVLIWEMFERGAKPYNGMEFEDFKKFLQSGQRLRCPQQCPTELYDLMKECWDVDPVQRPTFDVLKEKLEKIFQDITICEPAMLNSEIELNDESLDADETTTATKAKHLDIQVVAMSDGVDVYDRNEEDPLLT